MVSYQAGRSYYSLGRKEDALADLNRALAIDEKLAQSLAARGQLHLLAKSSNDPTPPALPIVSPLAAAFTPPPATPVMGSTVPYPGAPNPPMPVMQQPYSASPYPGAPNPPMPNFNNTPGYYGSPTNNLQY